MGIVYHYVQDPRELDVLLRAYELNPDENSVITNLALAYSLYGIV